MKGSSVAEEITESHYVPALRKGLSLLELLADRGPMTLAAVERASGLNRTMSYRLLRVLGELGYVDHDPLRHDYDLGFRLLGLGAAVAERLNLVEAAWPFLDGAHHGGQETMTLAVLAGNQVVYLGMLDVARGTEIAKRFAGRHAPHATSVGKAILAFLPDEVRGVKVASLEPLTKVTPSTIVDREALQRELARTRERGYALEDEENAIGARGVGVPVLDSHGHPVAAVGINGPAAEFDLRNADRTAARLWQVSREMSRQLADAPTELAS
jgi:DNA-binding IclR family transcriptional regulator